MASEGNRVWFPAILLLLGCSSKGREASLQFLGQPPCGAFAADTRRVIELCPGCAQPVAREAARCPHVKGGRPCDERLRHAGRGPCGFCRGTKKCLPCALFETAGRCRACGGNGRLEGRDCFNCAGAGRCVACGGTERCDACGGSGELKLPWAAARARPAAPSPAVTPILRRVDQDRYVLWLGESVRWSVRSGDDPGEWIVLLAEDGRRKEVERVAGNPVLYKPPQPGFYVARAGSVDVHFDVIEVVAKGGNGNPVRPGTTLTAWLESVPALREGMLRWEVSVNGGGARPLDAAGPSGVFPTPGRYEVWPVAEIPGLPPLRAPRPVAVTAADLRVVPPAQGPLPAGAPLLFHAKADPSLGPGASYEWTVEGPDGVRSVTTSSPSEKLALPSAGKHTVRVRSGSCVSPAVDLTAFSVTVLDSGGRVLPEASLALLAADAFDPQGRLRDVSFQRASERVRVVVDDPAAGAEPSVSVMTRLEEGTMLNPPITLTLGPDGKLRTTRPFVLLSDPIDARAEAGGAGDQATNGPTLYAVPRGRLEVIYRGVPAASVAVGPMILYEIPVRFFVLAGGRGPALPSKADWEAIADHRLRQANAVWEPFGRRFTRASLEIAPPPRHLLLVRGRAAGVDEHGRPGRSGALFNGVELSVPTAWRSDSGPVTPAETARALAHGAGPEWMLETFDNLFPTEREAVVLRAARKDLAGVKVEPLREGQDVSQGASPLSLDRSEGLEVAKDAAVLSLEEVALILGLRGSPPRGVDLFVVSDLRAGPDGRDTHKVYPGWAFPAALADSVVLSRRIMDGSDRYPYALASSLGRLLLPAGYKPRPEDTLFAEELSEKAGVNANKRVGAETGGRIRARGRVPAGPK